MIQAVLGLFMAFVVRQTLEVRNVTGGLARPFRVEGAIQVLFFLSRECPISRFYAREIQAICSENKARGAGCALVFEDLPADAAATRLHLQEFGYRGIPAMTDATGKIAVTAGATVTPQAVVLDKSGTIRYSGRIDNYYADLGKPRRQATTHDLRDALGALAAGRPVPNPATTPIGCFIVSPDLFKEKK
jgi:hypothetical protein